MRFRDRFALNFEVDSMLNSEVPTEEVDAGRMVVPSSEPSATLVVAMASDHCFATREHYDACRIYHSVDYT